MYFDPAYFIFALPGLLLALWAQFKTKSTFEHYSRVASRSGVTGAEAAQRLLFAAGVSGVKIVETDGFLTDHYDPSCRTLRLSPDVYGSSSLSAIGVACHEAGHAIQHAHNYGPLEMRSSLVPVINITSPMSYIFIAIGAIFASPAFIWIGIICFCGAVLFSLVTLPVEYNASSRAKEMMVSAGIVSSQESNSAGEVLNAAFLTYVAAAVSSLLTLLYYLWRLGVFSRRD
ncbi:MAG: zinc metallopeptidase [Lentisphaeria bacterium]|nr:zinc metallopeptidase [Lentisphaeria bacterium]